MRHQCLWNRTKFLAALRSLLSSLCLHHYLETVYYDEARPLGDMSREREWIAHLIFKAAFSDSSWGVRSLSADALFSL